MNCAKKKILRIYVKNFSTHLYIYVVSLYFVLLIFVLFSDDLITISIVLNQLGIFLKKLKTQQQKRGGNSM